MLKEIEQLLVLQDRDQNIKAIQAELTTVPLEQKRIDHLQSSSKEALEQARQKLREIEVEKKRLELDAQSRRDSIAKYKTQQFQTRKNEEFQALGHEIQRLEKEVEKIEDKEIEAMEQIEKLQAEVTSAERGFKEASAQVERQSAGLKQKHAALEERLRETEVERKQLAEGIDPDLLFRYTRLFASKGGNAVVPVEHEVCMGCHMKNTTTLVHRVKLNIEILQCEQCGRILYSGD
jgi:predicted  nucleic acid-binding Zn-ribbon protein